MLKNKTINTKEHTYSHLLFTTHIQTIPGSSNNWIDFIFYLLRWMEAIFWMKRINTVN